MQPVREQKTLFFLAIITFLTHRCFVSLCSCQILRKHGVISVNALSYLNEAARKINVKATYVWMAKSHSLTARWSNVTYYMSEKVLNVIPKMSNLSFTSQIPCFLCAALPYCSSWNYQISVSAPATTKPSISQAIMVVRWYTCSQTELPILMQTLKPTTKLPNCNPHRPVTQV